MGCAAEAITFEAKPIELMMEKKSFLPGKNILKYVRVCFTNHFSFNLVLAQTDPVTFDQY